MSLNLSFPILVIRPFWKNKNKNKDKNKDKDKDKDRDKDSRYLHWLIKGVEYYITLDNAFKTKVRACFANSYVVLLALN